MNFKTAIYTCIVKKYCTFAGRASRSEYWFFFLFNFLTQMTFSFINVDVVIILSMFYSLALLLPGLGAAARRLHDIDRSAWWLLLGLIPLIGFIVLIVFFVKKGTEGENRFGSPVIS